MNWSESVVGKLLPSINPKERWKFVAAEPQSKKYNGLDYYVAYPDFELYVDNKLFLLVEVKGYFGFFDKETNSLAMKLRHFVSYKTVSKMEGVPIRVCFVIRFSPTNVVIFWESLENISKFGKFVEERTFREWDYSQNKTVEKIEKYIFWNASDFRTDHENIPKI